MKSKLNSVLLIDDDDITNFINKKMIVAADCALEIKAKQTAKGALSLLEDKILGNKDLPELIFLDINMPAMNGWEFIQEYKKLPQDARNQMRIVMLTTSVNPDDRSRALDTPEIDDFMTKPLSVRKLSQLMIDHFNYTPMEKAS